MKEKVSFGENVVGVIKHSDGSKRFIETKPGSKWRKLKRIFGRV